MAGCKRFALITTAAKPLRRTGSLEWVRAPHTWITLPPLPATLAAHHKTVCVCRYKLPYNVLYAAAAVLRINVNVSHIRVYNSAKLL